MRHLRAARLSALRALFRAECRARTRRLDSAVSVGVVSTSEAPASAPVSSLYGGGETMSESMDDAELRAHFRAVAESDLPADWIGEMLLEMHEE